MPAERRRERATPSVPEPHVPEDRAGDAGAIRAEGGRDHVRAGLADDAHLASRRDLPDARRAIPGRAHDALPGRVEANGVDRPVVPMARLPLAPARGVPDPDHVVLARAREGRSVRAPRHGPNGRAAAVDALDASVGERHEMTPLPAAGTRGRGREPMLRRGRFPQTECALGRRNVGSVGGALRLRPISVRGRAAAGDEHQGEPAARETHAERVQPSPRYRLNVTSFDAIASGCMLASGTKFSASATTTSSSSSRS